MSSLEPKIINIPDFWGRIQIPAILLDTECILSERKNVWIPEGYENGGGGYSTRKVNEILDCNLSDTIKKDIIAKWNCEVERCNNRT